MNETEQAIAKWLQDGIDHIVQNVENVADAEMVKINGLNVMEYTRIKRAIETGAYKDAN